MPDKKTVADIMISDIFTVEEQTPVSDAVHLMAQNNIGAVIVMSPIQDPVGIFTERDLLKRVVAHDLDPAKTPVSKVMTPKFVCIQNTDDVDDLPAIMVEGNFRHIPVVDGRKLVGILSIRDVLRFLAGL
ncbi:MAG: CBS domain-containing protein [Deltaproteobacteria bacterium]|nr:CBS domain-containing protein [Deltaproteobacteria bacterium]